MEETYFEREKREALEIMERDKIIIGVESYYNIIENKTSYVLDYFLDIENALKWLYGIKMAYFERKLCSYEYALEKFGEGDLNEVFDSIIVEMNESVVI